MRLPPMFALVTQDEEINCERTYEEKETGANRQRPAENVITLAHDVGLLAAMSIPPATNNRPKKIIVTSSTRFTGESANMASSGANTTMRRPTSRTVSPRRSFARRQSNIPSVSQDAHRSARDFPEQNDNGGARIAHAAMRVRSFCVFGVGGD